MTPEQFLTQIKQREPAPAYLFLGPEQYRRDWCVKALIQHVLPEAEDRGNGLIRRDIDETGLTEVLDEACCGSLFAARRVIVATNAESVLPKGKAASEEGDDTPHGSTAALARYMNDPPPGVVIVFEASRYDFFGDDKRKIERVRKFYEPVRDVVEFQRMSASQARTAAEKHAKRIGLSIGPAELDMLIEALGADAARIANEIEKLAVYASGGKTVGAAEIAELVPEARESTIFALVAALGRNDRAASLGILDTLIRQSEYLPLALSFLATQFRLALAAREAGLKSSRDIQGHFTRLGIPMWPSRADQVHETASRFTKKKLAQGLQTIFSADKALRDARPDDRVVMEEFVMRLTGA